MLQKKIKKKILYITKTLMCDMFEMQKQHSNFWTFLTTILHYIPNKLVDCGIVGFLLFLKSTQTFNIYNKEDRNTQKQYLQQGAQQIRIAQCLRKEGKKVNMFRGENEPQLVSCSKHKRLQQELLKHREKFKEYFLVKQQCYKPVNCSSYRSPSWCTSIPTNLHVCFHL